MTYIPPRLHFSVKKKEDKKNINWLCLQKPSLLAFNVNSSYKWDFHTFYCNKSIWIWKISFKQDLNYTHSCVHHIYPMCNPKCHLTIRRIRQMFSACSPEPLIYRYHLSYCCDKQRQSKLIANTWKRYIRIRARRETRLFCRGFWWTFLVSRHMALLPEFYSRVSDWN